jgi:hypothetical protein
VDKNIHQPSQKSLKKRCLPACQKAYGNYFQGQKKSSDGGIHETRGHNNIRSVLQNTKNTASGHSKQKAWNAGIWHTRSAPA